MADDLGYGDVGGAFGNRTIPTPNVDRIGRSGISLTHSLAAASVCTPSRAAFLTSRYPVRTGMTSGGKNRVLFFVASSGGLPPQELTLPKALKKVGYRTALIGKWHLGKDHKVKGDMVHHPLNHGFDYFYGLPLSNIKDFGHHSSVVTSYYPRFYALFTTIVVIGLSLSLILFKCRYRKTAYLLAFLVIFIPGAIILFIKSFSIINSVLMRNDKVVEQPIILEGITSRFVIESKKFIDKSKDDGKPFFLMMSFVKVHSAHFPSSSFKGKSRHTLYGDCLMELDWGVGQILDHLRKLGIHEDTIVYFTSDNGGHLEEVNEHDVQEGGYNGQLRGGKSHGAMEGGIRVPTIISWPKTFPANKVISATVSLMDLFPTILNVVNETIPDNLDGKSMLPLLMGESDHSPHEFLFHYCGTYLHGVTYIEDNQYVWKVYFYTPKFKNELEYKCTFICQCYGSYVIQHKPPKVFNLAEDPTEKVELTSYSSVYSMVLQKVNDAVKSHQSSLKEVVSQFSLMNSIWKPQLQPCCNFPFCSCRDLSL